MDHILAASLLNKAMESPKIVDELLLIKHGTPQGRDSFEACLRLDKMLGGNGRPNSPTAIELSNNAALHLASLMDPLSYPEQLRRRADMIFPPFGRLPKWSIPKGFQKDSKILTFLENAFTKMQIQAKLRRPGLVDTLIVIYKPAKTKLLYPWQQAINTDRTLTTWNFQAITRISSRYVQIGNTKAYEVCFRTEKLECARVTLLIEERLQQMFEFQALLLEEKKQVFDDFLSDLR